MAQDWSFQNTDFSSSLEAWNSFYMENSVTGSSGDIPVPDPSFNPSTFNFGNMGGLATGLKVGGSILGGFGAIQQGNEIAGADHYNADLVRQQEQISEEELSNYGEELAGEQRAGYAKAGVQLSGSPLDNMLSSTTNIEMDKQIMKYNSESKARMYEYEAEVAKSQARFKMGQSLLSGGLGLLGLGL